MDASCYPGNLILLRGRSHTARGEPRGIELMPAPTTHSPGVVLRGEGQPEPIHTNGLRLTFLTSC